ncbi:MAG: transpeptidase family protein [Bacteroidia bacterium]|nr:transpeptidase family protein [Bacteroidia bacterium]
MSTKKTKNKINVRRAILIRAYVVFGLALLFALSVLVAAARLQMGSDKEFSQALKQKNTRVVNVKAIRGNIYAGDGSMLATSVPMYNLVFDAKADGLTNELIRQKLDSLCTKLATEFPEKNPAAWRNYLLTLRQKNIRYTLIKKDLTYIQIKAIKKWPLINMGKFKSGFWWEEETRRLYFLGELARRTIGYSRNGIYVGLEGGFDSLLRGSDGQRMEQRMPGNVWRPVQVGNYKDPSNGYDIITTLDVQLQDVAQNSLRNVLAENEADHGCAVVMEVGTGAIKAIANLKRGKDGIYFEEQNYAVDEFSDPGSTFKLFSALALLEDGYAKNTDSVNVEGGKTKFYGETMEDATKPNKNILTLQEVFEKSSNVGVSKLIVKHYGNNPQKFTDRAIDLGLNIKPDFDIKSSNNPRIKTKKSSDWSAISLPWMSIGYEIKMSPLQILMLYNAIANNGTMLKPYMVKEIRQEGRMISKIEPVILNKSICKPETVLALKKMMEGVVENGTATNLKNTDYTVAGKTGTAQIYKSGGYDKSSYKASFVGYFPANNPQYTVIVVINEPRKGKYYGGAVAGPVFKAIADRIYSSSVKLHPGLAQAAKPFIPTILNGDLKKTQGVLNYLGISSHMDTGVSFTAWIKAKSGDYSIKLSPIKSDQKRVPDASGMGIRDAILLFEERHLKVSYQGYGRVVDQSIKPGSTAIPGQTIHLTLKPF